MLASKIIKNWDPSGYNWQLRAPGKSDFFESRIISSKPYDSVDNKLDETGWIEFDVTEFVKGVQSGATNNGIGITMFPYSEEGLDDVWYMYHRYASADYVKNTELRPKLEIVTVNDVISVSKALDNEFQHHVTTTLKNGVLTVIPGNEVFSSGNLSIDIYTLNGRVIHSIQQAQLENGVFRVNLNNCLSLSSGSYVIKVYNNKASTVSKLLAM